MSTFFLPNDYQGPSSNSRYFKLEDGENKIRILSAPILGWMDWQGNKAVRYQYEDKPKQSFDPKRPVKHFWAVVIYDYASESILIWEITQASVRTSIEAYFRDSEWGNPYFYDLKISKTGSGMDTRYTVKALPHKMLPSTIKQLFLKNRCRLEALFMGEDPWVTQFVDESELTKGIFGKEDLMLPASSKKEEDDDAIPF